MCSFLFAILGKRVLLFPVRCCAVDTRAANGKNDKLFQRAHPLVQGNRMTFCNGYAANPRFSKQSFLLATRNGAYGREHLISLAACVRKITRAASTLAPCTLCFVAVQAGGPKPNGTISIHRRRELSSQWKSLGKSLLCGVAHKLRGPLLTSNDRRSVILIARERNPLIALPSLQFSPSQQLNCLNVSIIITALI